jgi:hypothetical protein
MTAQSLYSRVAPKGGAQIYTFKQLDPARPGDQRENERALEDLLDAAHPGWREVLVKRQYPPRIEAVGGFAGRPDSRVPGIANLYLAGDWVGPERRQHCQRPPSGAPSTLAEEGRCRFDALIFDPA